MAHVPGLSNMWTTSWLPYLIALEAALAPKTRRYPRQNCLPSCLDPESLPGVLASRPQDRLLPRCECNHVAARSSGTGRQPTRSLHCSARPMLSSLVYKRKPTPQCVEDAEDIRSSYEFTRTQLRPSCRRRALHSICTRTQYA
jgi:hypothetical protein